MTQTNPYADVALTGAAAASDAPVNPYASLSLADDHAAVAAAKARTAAVDPDAFAEAIRLGRATGTPPDVAARNLDQVRQMKTAQDLRDFASAHPAGGAWMADGHNAAIAHDDTPALGRIATATGAINRVPAGHWGGSIKAPVWMPGPAPVEQSLGSWLIDAFRAPTDPHKQTVGTLESASRMGAQGVEELTSLLSKVAAIPAGALDSLHGLATLSNHHELQDAIYRNVVDPQEELVQRLAIDPKAEQQSAGADVSGRVAHAVPELVVAVGTGGAAEPIALREGGSVALNWLRNALLKAAYASPGVAVPAGAQKFSESTAAGDSAAVAATKDAGTMLETTAAMAVPLAGKTKLGSAALGAAGMPAISTVLSWLHGNGTPDEREMVSQSIIGALTGAAFGGSDHPAKITTSEHNARALEDLMQAAAESKLAKRSAEHLSDFIDTLGQHTVSLPTEEVAQHFEAAGLDPATEVAKIVGNPDAYMEAEGAGHLDIPLSDYVTRGQELHAALAEHARLDPEGIAPAQIPDAAQAHAEALDAAEATQAPAGQGISTKDALMQAARVARGLAPLEVVPMPGHEEQVSAARERMAANPNAADEIVAAKLAGDTTINPADEAVLQVRAVDLTNQMEAQANLASDPAATPEAREIARAKGEELATKFDQLNQATKATGAAWSAFGRQRMQELLRDYSFGALLRKETTRLMRPLQPEEVARIKEQADRIAQLEAEAAQHAQALAEALAPKRPAGPKKSVDERAQERLRADIAKLEATIQERLTACPL